MEIKIDEKIDNVLKKMAPEYISFWNDKKKILLKELKDIIQETPEKYRDLKIIENIAFWFAFTKEYQSYPPIISKNIFPDEKNIVPMNKGKKIGVVIPIGCNNPTISCFLFRSLKILNNYKRIKKVICILDGIILPAFYMNWIESRKKIEYIILKKQKGPAIARNQGLIKLKDDNFTDIILLDSDIYLKRENLISLITEYLSSPINILFPLIKAVGNDLFDQYYDYYSFLNGRLINNKKLLFGTTAFIIMNQSIFNNTSFDESFPVAGGEDVDFCLKILEKGYTLNTSEKIIKHFFGTELKTFKKRFERYGRGVAVLQKKRPYFYYWLNNSKRRLIQN